MTTIYACPCLNIRIYAEQAERVAKAESCPLSPSCETVELVDEGFHFSHKSLVQRMREGDWTMYVCVPCRMRTHGVNTELKLVVVNTAMTKGAEAIAAMEATPDYSRAFKLLLRPAARKPADEDDETIPRQSYETLQKQLGELQHVLAGQLDREEKAMEGRIRKYEEEQRNNFIRLRKQLQLEKTKLVSLLFQKSEGRKVEDESERVQMRRHMTISHSKSSGEYECESAGLPQRSTSRRLRDSSPDVFAMDGLDLEESDTPHELSSRMSVPLAGGGGLPGMRTSASHRTSAGVAWRVAGSDLVEEEPNAETEDGGSVVSLMSTSVPITMPLAARSLRREPRHYEQNSDEETSADFEDIPRQMEALSRSIQDNDRYIFGDRPRQRVNTGDFTQVKWH